jgi:tetratricopeptide (TPR) repeat protein
LLDETLQGCDDLDLWLRISRLHKFVGIPEALVLYRMHRGGLSSNELHMFRDRLKVISKHFGPDEGDPLTWSDEKRRAFGFAYRLGAIRYIQQGQLDDGWRLLAQAVEAYPHLLERLDTSYELACGDQPREYRGQAKPLDIEKNGAEMLTRLDHLVSQASPMVAALRRTAYGNAHLALAMLSDQAGNWAAARRHLLRAMRFHPDFLRDPLVFRRFVKLCLGQRVIRGTRRLPSDSTASPTEQK